MMVPDLRGFLCPLASGCSTSERLTLSSLRSSSKSESEDAFKPKSPKQKVTNACRGENHSAGGELWGGVFGEGGGGGSEMVG